MQRVIALSGVCILGIASALSGTSAAQGGRGPVAPVSLSQMTDEVDLIAEVVVESVFPPALQRQSYIAGTAPILMHRDALLRVTRLLKGSEPSSHIVWAGEFGSPLRGNQSPYPLLNVGRSAIIFVKKAPKEVVERLAERTQPRYDVRHGRAGIVDIDQDGKVHLMATLPFRAQYEGKEKSLMIADVESLVRATGAKR